MGKPWTNSPGPDGDDYAWSPMKNTPSLLAASRALGSTRRLETDEDRNLYTVLAKNPGTGLPTFTSTINNFNQQSVAFNVETTILTYTVPAGQTFYVTGIQAWGEDDAEYYVKVDGVIRGGGHTWAGSPNLDRDYKVAPITASAGQVVTVTGIHMSPSNKTLNANLMGGLA